MVTATQHYKYIKTQCDLEAQISKFAAIKTREARLIKWEKEVKVKEGKLEFRAKEKLRLQSYAERMENKVYELTKSITTVKVRTEILESNETVEENYKTTENITDTVHQYTRITYLPSKCKKIFMTA